MDEETPAARPSEPLPSKQDTEDVLEFEEGLSRLHPTDMEDGLIEDGEPSPPQSEQGEQGEFKPYSFDLEEPDLDPRFAFGMRKPRKEKPDYPAIIKLRPDLDPEVDEEELEEVKRVSQIRRQTEKKRRSKVSLGRGEFGRLGPCVSIGRIELIAGRFPRLHKSQS